MNRAMSLDYHRGKASLRHSHPLISAGLVLCGICMLSLGCGSGEKRIPTFTASGKVIAADGSPLPHALVVLHPVSGGADAPRPRGTTDTEGRYQLTTYHTNDGAPEGQYAVTVEQWIRDDPNLPPTNHLPLPFSKAESSGVRILIAKGENALEPIEVRTQ